MQTSDTTRTVPELVNWVRVEGFSLNLNPDRLAFLLASQLIAHGEEKQEISEAELHDAFGYVSQCFDQKGETRQQRANNAIHDLVQQRLLNRFGSEGLEEKSLYRLTPLGLAICDFYAKAREISKVRLSILLGQLASELNKAYQAVLDAGEEATAQHWEEQVFAVLKYSVSEIFERVDLAQRQMDEQQHAVKEEIASLLGHDWEQAISSCEQLLRETSLMLRELQDTLNTSGEQLQSILMNILDGVQADENLQHISEICHQLQSSLDNTLNWGQQCIELWSRYDKHVHKFIRTAIDMDQSRALSRRIREQLRRDDAPDWRLLVASEARLMELRDETLVIQAEDITGALPEHMEFQDLQDIQEQLSLRVRSYLDSLIKTGQPLPLADVMQSFLEEEPHSGHFDLARLIIEETMKLGYSRTEAQCSLHQPDWKAINRHGAEVAAYTVDTY